MAVTVLDAGSYENCREPIGLFNDGDARQWMSDNGCQTMDVRQWMSDDWQGVVQSGACLEKKVEHQKKMMVLSGMQN